MLHVARALREQEHEATLVVPQWDASPSTPALAGEWHAEGFSWLPVASANQQSPPEHFPKDRGLATARRLAGIVEVFDAAWFFERHWAMPLLRARRFRDGLRPVVVLDSEPDQEFVAKSMEEINRMHSSRYASRWADLVCGGSENEAKQSVRRVEEFWRERSLALARAIRAPATSPAVTVCVPYFEAAAFLPEMLRSLERQTSSDFTVVVVDDGSSTEEGRRAFDACAERYAGRGWRFVRQANLYPGAARNRAAREARTEFLLFLDSDDIAMPSMVERFLRGALVTGDDCLVAPNYGFVQDPEEACALFYDPPGNSLIGSMADDMHGGACIFVRREAFLSVGGFTELRGVGFEDYQFHVRCNLEGIRWDVLPEMVYRYRIGSPGSVSQSTPGYKNLARVRSLYEERLRGSGLEQLPLALAAAFWGNEARSEREAHLKRELAQRLPKLSPTKHGLQLLLLTCYFPFGAVSGWHKRVQEMIRYFGSRYELTLVAPVTPEVTRDARREALHHLHLVRGVKGGCQIPLPEDIPSRARELYVDSVQAALRALPTGHYHAVLIDQIFLAEFRKDIETVAVLAEHNIESRLVRQVADTSWSEPSPEYQDAQVEAARFEQYENRVWPDFPLRSVVSQVDKAQMDSRVKTGKTVVAPNGADPSIWLSTVRYDTATALFPGSLSYFPNVDAVNLLLTRIWPKLRKRKPCARLILAGREPSERMKSAAASAQGVELRANPKSMADLARRASVMVVPLRLGSGTRQKILESLAWGLPVVSTRLGAEGIDAVDGEHLLIRDDPDEFVDAIVLLMSDQVLWQKLRKAGRELVRERYSWDHVFKPLEDELIELVS